MELSKILFGTMDEDDAKYFIDQIKLFEQNSEDMNTLLKQQLFVVRSSLRAVNTLRTGDADLRFYVTTVQDG